VGKQAPPARAAALLVRALRGARGTLLFAIWTTPSRRRRGSFLHADPRSFFARRLTFTEGFDTADLKAAKALLDELL
jgi:hypothetical protein